MGGTDGTTVCLLLFVMTDLPHIAFASFTTLHEGLVELTQDWHEEEMPMMALLPPNEILTLRKLPPQLFGVESGYFFLDGKITFVLDPAHYPWLDDEGLTVRIGGEFNDWNPEAEPDRWRLRAEVVADRRVLAATFSDDPMFSGGRVQFKFMTSRDRWLSPPDHAPNRAGNELWNLNLEIDPVRTGHHRFVFTTREPMDLAVETFVTLGDGGGEAHLIVPGQRFFELGSALPLGAIVEGDTTTFRVFAPRARRLEVRYFKKLDGAKPHHRVRLTRNAEGVWEGSVEKNLHRWFYWLFLDGASNESVQFKAEFPVVDPYALALVAREGPGIILDRASLPDPADDFKTPQWQDLVIAEVHVRDAVARAPIRLADGDRLGFSALRKWVQSKAFHLKQLGVNAVELQPVQEFDNGTRDEYHWGYMPVNYFAPESSYAKHPEKASQVEEFQALVGAFHEQGMAVILDVVYNHVGIPNHLLLIDREYYFELDTGGHLLNWSGCGNDLRADAAMARRLIIDSLVHFVECYGVDGFRFDLAELLGVETLHEVERRLKEVKPDIILIAEPWSFRGHIGRQLRDTGFSSWNDAYRDFMREFVRGHGNHDAVRFFLSGSPGALAAWPAQTVNYVESHDDRSWIDMITENEDHNGFFPTPNDRRRTHLMVAFLMSSLGIPMIAAGQDFLRSKHGVNNTYQRGDLNALDYERLTHFPETHAYFAGWIAFRLSERGRFFRLWTRPGEDYLRLAFAEHAASFAAVFNADGSEGGGRLLVAINPHEYEVTIPLAGLGSQSWLRLADAERFVPGGLGRDDFAGGEIKLPALGCGLWEG